MTDPSQSDHDPPGVEHIRSGNRKAFEELFRSHYEALCRFALNYVEHLRVAEDLVQDVFVDLWKDRRSLEVEHSLKAYLYGMTRHRALKYLRQKQVRKKWAASDDLRKAAPPAMPDQAEDILKRREQQKEVDRALEALPQRRRQIFLLSRRHSLTYAEIAVALDISIKTVETQMSRALQFLRDRLEVFLS
jgi:RNA polymerase sigma-70 factor (ECF subfamily)